MNANYSSSPGVSMSLWDDSDTPTEIYHLYLLIQEKDMQLKKKVTRKEKQLNQIMKEKLYRIEKDTNFLNCPLQELSQEAH